ncbi:hypothetical protein OG225_06455 [Nocardia sp. NBC_01377]|uniref:hypothetical protein n=1 Tax=Nocardia sp. NBC_01377 TaxID=2903595 RepID=UPI003244036F
MTLRFPTLFQTALFCLHGLHTTHPALARQKFPDILPLASEAERAVLDQIADAFTQHPFQTAHKRIDALWRSVDEDLKDLVNAAASLSDPGLYQPTTPEFVEVSLAAAELPPMPMRMRYRPAVTTRRPSRAIDAARHHPDAIAARTQTRALRSRPIPGDHRAPMLACLIERERRVDEYTDTNLFRDATSMPDPDDSTLEPETPQRHRQRPTANEPATANDQPVEKEGTVEDEQRARELKQRRRPRDHEESTTGWDREYLNYVLGQHEHLRRDTDQTLDQATTDYLADHDTDAESAPQGRRARQGARRRGDRVAWGEAEHFARQRTGLRVRDDARPEIPTQGNGLDYDAAAMVPVMGWRCVSCFIERAMTDQRPLHSRGGRLVSDDGLCDSCRADDRPGIAPLPEKFTLEQFAVSRCDYLTTNYPTAAHALIIEVWNRASPHPICRHLTRYLATHPELTPNPNRPFELTTEPDADRTHSRRSTPTKTRKNRVRLGAGQRHGRCEGCLNHTVVHADNYCTGCRIELATVIPARRTHAA